MASRNISTNQQIERNSQRQGFSSNTTHASPTVSHKRKANCEDNAETNTPSTLQSPAPSKPSAHTPQMQKRHRTASEQLLSSPLISPAQVFFSNFNSHISVKEFQEAQLLQHGRPQQQQQQQQQTPSPSVPLGKIVKTLFQTALSSDPTLLPMSSINTVITGAQIDNLAYTIWDIAMKQGPAFTFLCNCSSLFSHLKLSVLARLNYLPSWWLLRETIVKIIIESRENGGMGSLVDDSVMQGIWKQAFCSTAEQDEAVRRQQGWGGDEEDRSKFG